MAFETHQGRELTLAERIYALELAVLHQKGDASARKDEEGDWNALMTSPAIFSRDREYEGHPQFDELVAGVKAKRGTS